MIGDLKFQLHTNTYQDLYPKLTSETQIFSGKGTTNGGNFRSVMSKQSHSTKINQ